MLRLATALIAVALLPGMAVAQGTITVTGDVPATVILTDSALQAMPRTEAAMADHGQAPVSYQGVQLRDLLARAGVDLFSPLRGAALARSVVIEASDGYRVVFAIAELDPSISASVIVLADRKAGAPLDSHEGPFRLVAPSDRRAARSVRQVTTIRLVDLPTAH